MVFLKDDKLVKSTAAACSLFQILMTPSVKMQARTLEKLRCSYNLHGRPCWTMAKIDGGEADSTSTTSRCFWTTSNTIYTVSQKNQPLCFLPTLWQKNEVAVWGTSCSVRWLTWSVDVQCYSFVQLLDSFQVQFYC